MHIATIPGFASEFFIELEVNFKLLCTQTHYLITELTTLAHPILVIGHSVLPTLHSHNQLSLLLDIVFYT